MLTSVRIAASPSAATAASYQLAYLAYKIPAELCGKRDRSSRPPVVYPAGRALSPRLRAGGGPHQAPEAGGEGFGVEGRLCREAREPRLAQIALLEPDHVLARDLVGLGRHVDQAHADPSGHRIEHLLERHGDDAASGQRDQGAAPAAEQVAHRAVAERARVLRVERDRLRA